MKINVKDKNYYLNLPYTMEIKKDDDEFVAFYKEYPKITGVGDSEIEAIKDFKEAFSTLLDVLLEDGKEIIEPKPVEKKVRVNIFISERILKEIKKISNNRSDFLAKAAEYVIENKKVLL
ncbi:type II toxin-antitoxin system HicB family antitoxin [Campylobacter ureolyticus]|uniref:type II toxin-antitoxin system HicB family antitoxin n=1 Tax=Campylobacter ureolyticus TaxID=827 RepID=UPI001FC89780|nr:type II toxin-antitoxin system HicB family antitoxin [Campylobacter ureolyticus]MCZ6106043.1 type II toxin-antitoxin system HicB family antitoxin [Campylobacter ureolyticus]MCZ6158741.1 type II toxin-antitoxin system HicB family antitoxin [Campylobacter ureolyticus]GKH61384.1 hypothetical protein CE91St25_17200 [Campylobacter ureolyticus]